MYFFRSALVSKYLNWTHRGIAHLCQPISYPWLLKVPLHSVVNQVALNSTVIIYNPEIVNYFAWNFIDPCVFQILIITKHFKSIKTPKEHSHITKFGPIFKYLSFIQSIIGDVTQPVTIDTVLNNNGFIIGDGLNWT